MKPVQKQLVSSSVSICWHQSSGRRKGTLAAFLTGLMGVGFLLCASYSAFAQVQTARIDGFVHDASGAVIPGAAVTLKDEVTGTESHTTTDQSGFYDLEGIQPKTYTLTVALKGFKTTVQQHLVVHPDDRLSIPVTLQVATQVQEVEVTASAVQLVTTDTGAKTDVIGAHEIENLSTLSRTAVELISLLPGVVGFSTNPSSGFNPLNGTSFGTGVDAFNVNGLRNDMNDVRLDSAHMIDPGCNCGNIVEPDMDMIQEFSVKTSNFEADQGRSAMIMDTVMKSGGSHIHGEAYYYGRNAVLNANDFSNNLAGVPRPASKFNYPGFNIGGPVRFPHSDFNKRNDKMFFFFATEWQRQLPDPGTLLEVVPTQKMRQGDFTELLQVNTASGQNACAHGGRAFSMPCQLQDPNTWGSSLASNILPPNTANISDPTVSPNGVTPAGMIMLNQFPLPNYSGSNNGVANVDPTGQFNYASRPLVPLNRNLENARIDFNIKDNLRAYIHLARNYDNQFYPWGLWAGQNSGWTSNVPEPTRTLGINSGESVVLNIVQVINPTLTNEVQFNSQALNLPNHYVDPSKISKSALGLKFPGMTFTLPQDPYFAHGQRYTGDIIPQITDAWSYGPAGGGNPGLGRWGEGDVGSTVFADKTEFEWLDNLTKVHSTHTMKFGFSADRTRNDQNGVGTPPEGQLITQNWGGMGTNNEFGDILTEHFKAFNQLLQDRDGLWRFWNLEWYAQDSWKATHRLTLNFGARWSWMQPWNEVRGFATTFEPQVYNPSGFSPSNPASFLNGIVTAQSGKIPKSAFPNPIPILQPRVGFAYDIFGTGKTVVRGGFGTFVTRDQGNVSFYQDTSDPFSFGSSPNAGCGPGQFCGAMDLTQIATLNPFSSVGNITIQGEDTKDPNQPQTYEWSFMLEQNIGLKTVLQTAYVGNTTRHLFRSVNANALRPGTMLIPGSTDCCANGDTNEPDYVAYKPFGSVNIASHSDSSNYNSLQVTARRNVATGLTILANYTWSKTLGYTTSFQGVVDAFDAHRDYGYLPWDRSQLLNFSYIYQMPSVAARHRWNRFAKGVLDSWQLSGITRYQTGSPLYPTISSISCHDTTQEVNPTAFDANKNECSNGYFDNGHSVFSGGSTGWYGTGDLPLRPFVNWQGGNPPKVGGYWVSANSLGLPGIGKLGTYETPIFRGPGLWNYDLTLFKSFPFGENRRVEFRVAAFDILNHANPQNPDMGTTWEWDMPANLQPTTQNAYSMGKPKLLNGNVPSGFGYVPTAWGHREVEFALKLYF
jgi:carboxypeptidase family protein